MLTDKLCGASPCNEVEKVGRIFVIYLIVSLYCQRKSGNGYAILSSAEFGICLQLFNIIFSPFVI